MLMPLMAIGQERIMVIADPHVYPQTLIEADSTFDKYMQSQRKMLHLSEEIWYALVDTALKYQPDLVLIPGDLTRQAEAESHALVAASLEQLNEAGIPSLVIPGNHDIEADTAWEKTYPLTYAQAIAKDAESHSYAAEPFEGLTVIGIDGSHTTASVGSLSANTLAWILQQADAATEKGNTIIAMCHWQLLEHIDKQSRLESSCRLKNADAIRDSLMNHGVHLVLTGHFHVNGITTRLDSITGNDSIVEITTGSPITYPCPYRWLTLSPNRKTVTVETDYITSIASQPDLTTYSREWMREHARNMLPAMSLRLWKRVDEAKSRVAQEFNQTIADRLVNNCIPKTDSAKMALVDKYMGSTTVELYLLHSDANEPEHPEADSLANEVYTGMEGMISEMLDADKSLKLVLQVPMTLYAEALAKAPVQSLVEDVTQWGKQWANRTDDLHLTLTVGNGKEEEAIRNVTPLMTDGAVYDILGRRVEQPARHGVYIQDGKKVIK